MNNKEQKQLQISWVLVCLGSILAFFVNIAANSFYDMYFVDGFRKKFIVPFLAFSFISLFFANFFSYTFDRISEIKSNNYSFKSFFWSYIKSWFKK